MAGEQPDPSRIESRADLARELTALRAQSGRTVRQLARSVGAPVATVGDYFAGRHLPGVRQLPLFRALLAGCGVTDPSDQAAWEGALARVRQASDGRSAKGPAPYRGLEPFREVDADLFFGRGRVVTDVVTALRDRLRSTPEGTGVVALVGSSGAGKSSLLAAGVVPAVRAGAIDGPGGEWTATLVTVEDLVRGMALPVEDGRRSVVVVDQMEEAFTSGPERRAAAVARIERLAGTTLVLVALRSDFYQEAAGDEVLRDALQHRQVLLGPLRADELRAAIVEPARRVGASVDDGLVEVLLAELAPDDRGGPAHGPATLPMLSYALLAAWERAGRNQLTVADYREVGGIRGAVLQAAEALYRRLDEEERAAARRLFARLIRVDADGPPTRRRALRHELTETGEPGRDSTAATVLERFVAARLLTIDGDDVQISHEALLTAWPRLAEWVDADRGWLQLHDHLDDAARAWDANRDDPSLLWAGSRLEAVTEEVDGRRRTLRRLEADFLARSLERRDEQHRTERRRVRRTQQLLAAVAVLAVAAVAAAVVAVSSSVAAATTRDQALSRQVAIESQQLQGSDPSLAAQLAVAAYRISPTVQARSVLLDTSAEEVPTRLLGAEGPVFLALSGDGRRLAVATSGADAVTLYDLSASGAAVAAHVTVGPATLPDFAVAVDPRGRVMAVGDTAGRISLYDIADATRPALIGVVHGSSATVYSLAFSPDGTHLTAGSADGRVRSWLVADPSHPARLPDSPTPAGWTVKAVAYDPVGCALAAAGADGTLLVYPKGSPGGVTVPTGTTSTLEAVAFSGDGKWLAAGADDGSVHVYDVTDPGRPALAHPPLRDTAVQINAVAFDAGGQMAAGSSDGTLRLYDPGSWTGAGSFVVTNPITATLFTAGGREVATADSSGTVRLWPLPQPSGRTEPGSVFFVGFRDGGRRLFVGSDGDQGDVTVWDTSAGALRPTRLAEVELPAALGAVAGVTAVSPDGRVAAAADKDALLQLLDVSDPSRSRPLGAPLSGAKPAVEQATFSPDGRLLASGDDSGQVLVWDVSHPAASRVVDTWRDTTGEVLGVAFSPDGRLLAAAATDNRVRIYRVAGPGRHGLVASVGGFANYAYTVAFAPSGRVMAAGSADGTVRLWDIGDPARPRLIGRPLTGPAGYVFQVAISPDGRSLAAAATDHSIWVWDISRPAKPRLLDELDAGQAPMFAVAFSPDGGYLAASGSDALLSTWTAVPAVAEARVCASAGDEITRAEWSRYAQGAPYDPPCR